MNINMNLVMALFISVILGIVVGASFHRADLMLDTMQFVMLVFIAQTFCNQWRTVHALYELFSGKRESRQEFSGVLELLRKRAREVGSGEHS